MAKRCWGEDEAGSANRLLGRGRWFFHSYVTLFSVPLPYSLSQGNFHLFSQENICKAQRRQLLAFSHQSLSFKIPDTTFPRLGEADRQRGNEWAQTCEVPAKSLSSSVPLSPHPQAEAWEGCSERLQRLHVIWESWGRGILVSSPGEHLERPLGFPVSSMK